MNKIESDQTKIRVKEPVYLENITDIFDKIDLRWSKHHRKTVKMFMLDNEKYCSAAGILFIKATLSNLSFLQILHYFFLCKIVLYLLLIVYYCCWKNKILLYSNYLVICSSLVL